MIKPEDIDLKELAGKEAKKINWNDALISENNLRQFLADKLNRIEKDINIWNNEINDDNRYIEQEEIERLKSNIRKEFIGK